METIVDKLKARLIQRSAQAVDVAISQAQVVPVIERAAKNLQDLRVAMNEIGEMTGAVTADIWSVFGVLAESKDVLRSLKYDLGHDATLMANFVEIFMKKDASLLTQSLNEAEPATRAKALGKLDDEKLEEWLEAIMLIIEPPDEEDDYEPSRPAGQ